MLTPYECQIASLSDSDPNLKKVLFDGHHAVSLEFHSGPLKIKTRKFFEKTFLAPSFLFKGLSKNEKNNAIFCRFIKACHCA